MKEHDFKSEKVETNTDKTDFDEIREAYNKSIDDMEYNIRPIDKIREAYNKSICEVLCNKSIDEKCRQAVIHSKIKKLDFINHLWEHGVYYDCEGFFSRKVNLYNLKTGDFDIFVEPSSYYNDCPYDYNLISAEPEAAIRFALYLLGR